jgi:GNAT superfamily N-acetyltransferase
MSAVTIRPAVREDSADIARLFLLSSDGLAEYIWAQIAEPGESLESVGSARYAREGVAFSYENCQVAEEDDRVIGMVHSFPMTEDPGAEPEADPVLRPYAELEDYGSLYISGLALFETHRNKGIGTRLHEAARDRAKSLHLPQLSLICFERNEGAMRLYRRLGYKEIDRRAIVPHPALHYADGDAVLLALPVG